MKRGRTVLDPPSVMLKADSADEVVTGGFLRRTRRPEHTNAGMEPLRTLMHTAYLGARPVALFGLRATRNAGLSENSSSKRPDRSRLEGERENNGIYL